jgi:hypothetical protein
MTFTCIRPAGDPDSCGLLPCESFMLMFELRYLPSKGSALRSAATIAEMTQESSRGRGQLSAVVGKG